MEQTAGFALLGGGWGLRIARDRNVVVDIEFLNCVIIGLSLV